METKEFIGIWKIFEAQPLNGQKSDLDCLKNCQFELHDDGHVDWKLENLDVAIPMPLFECSAFEIIISKKGSASRDIIRFAAVKGQVINFEVKLMGISLEMMELRYDNWATLVCKKTETDQNLSEQITLIDPSYHLLEALRDGFFADLEIKASNGKVFKVHSTIVGLMLPPDYCHCDAAFWRNLSEEIVDVILHFVYGQILPENVTMKTAGECIDAISNIPEFHELSETCKTFLKNKPFMNQIIVDVEMIQSCCHEAIQAFGGSPSNDADLDHKKGKSGELQHHDFFHSPARVEDAFKQVLKNATIGLLHFIHLSSTISNAKKSLSRTEFGKILDYLKIQLKIFLKQIHKFLWTLKHAVPSLNLTVRLELAEHLLTSFESLMKLIRLVYSSIRRIFQSCLTEFSNSEIEKSELECQRVIDLILDEEIEDKRKTAESLEEVLLRRSNYEVAHLVHHFTLMHINFGEDSFLIFREEFFENGESNKIASFAWTMEQYAYEIPVLLFQLEAFQYLFEKQLDMKSFKFGFTVVSSCIEFYLSKCIDNRVLLGPLLDHINTLTDSHKLTEILKNLKLIDSDQTQTQKDQSDDLGKVSNDSLFLTESLFLPKCGDQSLISLKCIDKLNDLKTTDMQLIVESDSGDGSTGVVINCHRVILAARCPWFKRAFMAGMKESRERRMTISDSPVWAVNEFIRFIYTGRISSTEEQRLGIDHLLDLMILADRFEMDSLKDLCQERLKKCINYGTALTLLSLADQFTAGNLRATCIAFVLDHPSLASFDSPEIDRITGTSFDELSVELQLEMKDLIRWSKSTPEDFESLFRQFSAQ